MLKSILETTSPSSLAVMERAPELTLSATFRDWRAGLAHFSRRWFHDDAGLASQSMALEESHLPRLARVTVMTLSSATFLFLVWAAVTPLKEIARTEGQVLPSGYSQIVQHLEGGLVRYILVHEGEFVQKGQPLLTLGGAGTEEDYQAEQLQVETLSLKAERLKALLENREPDFSAISASVAATLEEQGVFETMRASQQAERKVLEEQTEEKRAALRRLSQAYATARTTAKTGAESQAIYADLNRQGLVARTSYLKKEEEYNIQRGEANGLLRQMEEGKRALREYERRSQALSAQQRDGVYAELRHTETDLQQARESLKKREDRIKRLDIRSPVAGYVKGLRVNTIGAVVPAGQTLMEIVPAGEQLILEAHISPQQVGRVAVGQEVQVKIDSYDYVRYGSIPGRLESVSAMTFTDEARHQDYYKGRIRLERNYAGQAAGAHFIIPGMTADADIVTGEKTILGYLLKPVQAAMQNAMHEQ
jgi:HlyD family secretion protein/adhesin transport system membrane fusion protein